MTPAKLILQFYKEFPFERIPEELRKPKVIAGWLRSGNGSLKDVPDRYLTDELRLGALSRVHRKSSEVDPAWESAQHILSNPDLKHLHADVHQKLLVDGSISKIDQSLVTRDFLLKAVESNGDNLIPYLDGKGGLKGLPFDLDQELIDAAVSTSASLFEAFRPEQYSLEAMKANLRNCSYSDHSFLKRTGHPTLMTDMMRDEGHWPSSDPRPRFLEDAVEKMMNCKGDRKYYHFYLRQFPLQDVVTEMRTPKRRQELLALLTPDEAIQYLKMTPGLKNDRVFKARLLEDELGL